MNRPCDNCGERYEAKRHTSRYCSTRCRVAAGRAVAKLTVVSDPVAEPATKSRRGGKGKSDGPPAPGTLHQAVIDAVADMSWVNSSDKALVALVTQYARELDRGQPIKILGPQFLAALKTLGGAPAERRILEVDKRAGGRLSELRASRA